MLDQVVTILVSNGSATWRPRRTRPPTPGPDADPNADADADAEADAEAQAATAPGDVPAGTATAPGDGGGGSAQLAAHLGGDAAAVGPAGDGAWAAPMTLPMSFMPDAPVRVTTSATIAARSASSSCAGR